MDEYQKEIEKHELKAGEAAFRMIKLGEQDEHFRLGDAREDGEPRDQKAQDRCCEGKVDLRDFTYSRH